MVVIMIHATYAFALCRCPAYVFSITYFLLGDAAMVLADTSQFPNGWSLITLGIMVDHNLSMSIGQMFLEITFYPFVLANRTWILPHFTSNLVIFHISPCAHIAALICALPWHWSDHFPCYFTLLYFEISAEAWRAFGCYILVALLAQKSIAFSAFHCIVSEI